MYFAKSRKKKLGKIVYSINQMKLLQEQLFGSGKIYNKSENLNLGKQFVNNEVSCFRMYFSSLGNSMSLG